MVNFNFIHSALGEIEGKKPNLGCGQWNWEGSFNSCVFRKKYWNVSYHIFMIFSNEFCNFFLFRAFIAPFTPVIFIVNGIITAVDVDFGTENFTIRIRRLILHTTIS